MATIYNVNKRFQGVNGYGTLFADQKYSATLAGATDTTLTIPGASATGAPAATVNPTYLAVFNYGAAKDVWVALNETAAAPAGAGLAATTSLLNPSAKAVKSGDVLHFYCTAGGDVSVELFATQEN